jgi:hypothetical protein
MVALHTKPPLLSLVFLPVLGFGQGAGPFFQSSTTPADQPNFLLAADVNRDHKIDIVIYSQETAEGPGVFLGNGDGTIKLKGYGPQIPNALYVAVGDVDGDRIPDVVTQSHGTSQIGGGITVLHGNGDGTFTSAYQYKFTPATSPFPGGIAIADVNQDGIPDIITSDIHGLVYIYIGLGGGNFRAPSAVQSSRGVSQIVTGDFDGDGNLDIAVALSFVDGTVSPAVYYSGVVVLFGAGDGTFSTQPTVQMPGVFPFSLATADFDGDGASDLVLGGLNDQPPQMIWGSKTRSFAPVAIGRSDSISQQGRVGQARLPQSLDVNPL